MPVEINSIESPRGAEDRYYNRDLQISRPLPSPPDQVSAKLPGSPYRSQHVNVPNVSLQHHFVPLNPSSLNFKSQAKSSFILAKQEALKQSFLDNSSAPNIPVGDHKIIVNSSFQNSNFENEAKLSFILAEQEALRQLYVDTSPVPDTKSGFRPIKSILKVDPSDEPRPLAAVLKPWNKDIESDMGKKNKRVTIGLQCDIPDRSPCLSRDMDRAALRSPSPPPEPAADYNSPDGSQSESPSLPTPPSEPPRPPTPPPLPPRSPTPQLLPQRATTPSRQPSPPPKPSNPPTPPPPPPIAHNSPVAPPSPPIPITPVVLNSQPSPPETVVHHTSNESLSDHSRSPSPQSYTGSEDLKNEIHDLAKSVDLLSHRFDQFLDARAENNVGMVPPVFGVGASVRNSTLKGSVQDSSDWYKLGPAKENKIHDDKATLVIEDDDVRIGRRGNWSHHIEFILSCLGYAVGLGNVWRFPYLCYRNGGGAFLIPYFIMLFLVGIPIFFLELSLGQFTSSSPLTSWKFAPVLGGIGIGMCLVSALVCIYYNMIIAYGFFYLFASFTSYLPWSDCNNYWNNDLCWERLPAVACNLTGQTKSDNGTCVFDFTGRIAGLWNITLAEKAGIFRQTASQQYWDHRVLEISDGIDHIGPMKWELVLVLLVAWLVVFLCLSKGIKTSGKCLADVVWFLTSVITAQQAVWFTALFPYCVILALVIRGVTLEGAHDGIRFYMTADTSRLLDARVWIDATNQIFFSLSDCFGGLITLASYNNFHQNTLRDSLIVSIGNCGTSIFAGFAIFSLLGYLAKQLDVSIDKVVKGGVDLAFVVYPEAIMRMPAAPTFWSIIFFLMIITLGMDKMFALVETITSSLQDRFPRFRRRKTTLVAVICLVLFLFGLSLTTRGGVYVLQLMDSYVGAWAMLIIAIVESLGVTWVYGPKNFIRDIRTMIGPNFPLLWGCLGYYWVALWAVFTPLLIAAVVVFTWATDQPVTYGDYIFPPWTKVLGVLMTTFIVIFIPIYAIYKICKADGTCLQRLWVVTSPTYDWGPARHEHRVLVAQYTPNYVVNIKEYERSHKMNKMEPKTLESGTQYNNPTFGY